VAAALRAAHSAGIAVTQGQFCFFLPRMTCCTDGVRFGVESPTPNFTPIGAVVAVCDPKTPARRAASRQTAKF